MARSWLECPADPTAGLLAEVFSLPRQPWMFGVRPLVLLVLKPRGGIGAVGAVLQQALGLTPSEAEVAILIAQGATRAEIAMRRSVSVETVVAQLKAIFSKADVRREAELVALIFQIAGK